MRYEKPEIEIEKFSILEDIAEDGVSAGGFNPIDEDNTGEIIFESLGEAIGNILDIK